MQLDVIILSEISQTEKDRFQGGYMLVQPSWMSGLMCL